MPDAPWLSDPEASNSTSPNKTKAPWDADPVASSASKPPVKTTTPSKKTKESPGVISGLGSPSLKEVVKQEATMRAATATEEKKYRDAEAKRASQRLSYDPSDPLGYAKAVAAREAEESKKGNFASGVRSFARGTAIGFAEPGPLQILSVATSPLTQAVKEGAYLAGGGKALAAGAKPVEAVARGAVAANKADKAIKLGAGALGTATFGRDTVERAKAGDYGGAVAAGLSTALTLGATGMALKGGTKGPKGTRNANKLQAEEVAKGTSKGTGKGVAGDVLQAKQAAQGNGVANGKGPTAQALRPVQVAPEGPTEYRIFGAADDKPITITTSEAMAKKARDGGYRVQTINRKMPDTKLGAVTAEPPQPQKRATQALPTEPAVPISPKQPLTGTRNAITEAERAARNADPIDRQAYTTIGDAYEKGRTAVEKGETDPRLLASSVASKPRVLTTDEVGALGYDRARLVKEERSLLDMAEKTNDPAKLEEIRTRREEVQRLFDLNDQALVKGGREQSAAFNARKLQIAEDFSPVAMKQRAKVAKAAPLTPEQSAKIDQLSKDLEAANAKIRDFEGRTLVEGIQGRRMRRTQTREQLNAEYDALVKSFAKTESLNIGLPPEKVAALGKIVENRIRYGATTVEGVVDEVFNSLSKHVPGLTREDVENAVSQSAPLQNAKARVQSQIEALEGKLQSGDISKPTKIRIPADPELNSLVARRNATRREYEQMVRALTPKTRAQKVVEGVNVARAIGTSFDISAPGRQGLIAAVNHPVIAARAFKAQIQSLASPQAYERVMAEIQSRPNAQRYRDYGLEITELGPNISGREEAYQTGMAEKLPLGIGRGIKASERAYTTFLNRMRADTFDAITSAWEKNEKMKPSEKQYQSLATLINDMTGRGDLGSMNKYSPALSAGLFSPRFVASRIRLLNPARYVLSPPGVRKELIKSMSKFVGAGVALIQLAKQNGAEVEDDPRSSDYGKIRVGNTRYDIWGGEQQYVRFFAQMASGETKNLRSGKIQSLAEPKFGQPNRAEHAIRFARGKLAPAPSFVWDMLAGENVVGEKFDIRDTWKRFVPMWTQDMAEAMAEHGNEKGAAMAAPALLGIGVQTFDPRRKK